MKPIVRSIWISLLLGSGPTMPATMAVSATELEVHRWVDADGVTHFSDAVPAADQPFETERLVIESRSETRPPELTRTAARPRVPQRRVSRSRIDKERERQQAQCTAWLRELRDLTERRRRGHTAAASARLRERSAEIMRLRQREC
jgi:Domain of unknown function (DUF4124)